VTHAYQNIIYKICSIYRVQKVDREDLFQEIVFQIWKSFPGFKGESKISTWIYRISINTAIAVYRKQKGKIDYYDEFPEHAHIPVENEPSENEERLFYSLQKLSDSEKAIISLYLDDFSYREIAKITGLTETNVGVRLNRIKLKLKEILK
jgi:RNA polymerase sigma factor (sigma-70 family)